MTAEHAHSWAVDPDQPGFSCLHCRVSGWHWHKDELKRLWDRLRTRTEEANCLELECARLRAELAVWQQRFGDSQATVLRQAAVVEAAREVNRLSRITKMDLTTAGLPQALRALDAVPRRAGTEPGQGFWTDPEFRNRNKDCQGPGCLGSGFLRNVPGPNELPCPVCRPIAAASPEPTAP